MNLLYYPNKMLSKTLNEVNIDNLDFDPKEIKEQMLDIMLSNMGIGLAANQVGLEHRLFVMGNTRDDAVLCINPTVIQYTEETQLDYEGCLSFPGINILVQRPRDVLVEYYNEHLEKVRTVASDYSARLYMHELDHLNGITFKDRVSKLKWNLAEKKAKKLVRR